MKYLKSLYTIVKKQCEDDIYTCKLLGQKNCNVIVRNHIMEEYGIDIAYLIERFNELERKVKVKVLPDGNIIPKVCVALNMVKYVMNIPEIDLKGFVLDKHYLIYEEDIYLTVKGVLKLGNKLKSDSLILLFSYKML